MSTDTFAPGVPREPTEAARLPAPLTKLVGREREVANVRELLRTGSRLVTLTGPGGVGKTRLAIAVAADLNDLFSHGIAFVRLAPITDPELVASTIAQALGVSEPPDGLLADALVAFLGPRKLLLVLDNFEQVLAAGPVLADLLAACPELSVLVTSRSVLRVSGEQAFAVPTLGRPDPARPPPVEELARHEAIQLFVERARAACADFTLTEANASTVAGICHRLDGLPLAIELAAARVTVLPPQAMVARLEHPLLLLSGGARDLPQRLRTMRDAIAWSHDLLSAAEQALFRRLAVFSGGCTLQAVGAIASAAPGLTIDVLDGVEALVNQSLLQQETQIDGEPRFLMLETLREFALERLAAGGDEDAVRRVHAAYFVGLAEEAEVGLRGPEQQRWRDRLEAELGNLRAALAWAAGGSDDPAAAELALRLGAALWYFWVQGHSPGEGRRWLLQALSAAPADGGGSARGKALQAAGVLAWRQGDYATGRAHLDESVRLLRRAGDLHGLADALHNLGHVLFEQGNYAGAEALFTESRARFEELGDMLSTVPLVGDLGMVAYHQGNYGEARGIFEESYRLSKQHGLTDRMADALNRLGDLARLAGDVDKSRTLYEESLALWKEARGTPGIASALHKLGQLSRHRRDAEQARALLGESLQLQRELGNKQGIAECLAALGGLAGERGYAEQAARLLAAAAKVLEVMGAPLAPADRVEFERDVDAARAALGEAAWQAASEEGQALTMEEAIAAALSAGAPVLPGGPSAASAVERPPGPTPEGTILSAREREVAILIARGLSNREIAAALTITEKTAANHVDHILTKLDMRSRTQIAVWAVQHDLAAQPPS